MAPKSVSDLFTAIIAVLEELSEHKLAGRLRRLAAKIQEDGKNAVD